MRYCGNCGAVNDTEARFCSKCGKQFENVPESDNMDMRTENIQPETNQEIPYAEGTVISPEPKRRLPVKNMIFGIVGFYFGVSSLTLCWMIGCAWPCAVIGLVFSILSLKGSEFRLAKAGKICSIIGLIVNLVILIGFFIAIFALSMQSGGGLGSMGGYLMNTPVMNILF